MGNIELTWTKDEFMAYLLIYAAQVNQIETEEEIEEETRQINGVYIKKELEGEYQRDIDFFQMVASIFESFESFFSNHFLFSWKIRKSFFIDSTKDRNIRNRFH